MTFKSQINVSLGWNWNEGAVDNGRLDHARQFLDSDLDNHADAAWNAKSRTLADGISITYDLTALEKIVLGSVHEVSFMTVKAVLIVNHGGGTLLVGGAAGNEWSAPFGSPGDQIAVPPDSPLLLCNDGDGWPVNSNHCNLKLTAGGGQVSYSLVVIGLFTAGYPSAE